MRRWHVYLGALLLIIGIIAYEYFSAKNQVFFVFRDDLWEIFKLMPFLEMAAKIIGIIIVAKILLFLIPY